MKKIVLDKYLHCKHCLGKQTKSGLMQVGVKGEELYVICENCDRPVWKTVLAHDAMAAFRGPCPCCEAEKKQK